MQLEPGELAKTIDHTLLAADARRAAANPDDLRRTGAQRVLCHLDIAAGHGLAELQAFAALQAAVPGLAYDLELIAACPPDSDLDAEFAGHAADLAASGLRPAVLIKIALGAAVIEDEARRVAQPRRIRVAQEQ